MTRRGSLRYGKKSTAGRHRPSSPSSDSALRQRSHTEVERDVGRFSGDENHGRRDRSRAVEGGSRAAFPAFELEVAPGDVAACGRKIGAPALSRVGVAHGTLDLQA